MHTRLVLGSLLGLLAFIVVLGGADSVHAGTFTPLLTVSVDVPEAGASSDYIVEFNVDGPNCNPIGSPPETECDVQFAGAVTFIPPEWGVTPGDEIPVGTVLGLLRADATLGLINGACNNVLPVEFIMMNGSIDIDDTIDFEEEGGDDPTIQDWAEDLDGNGLDDAVDKYPDFISRIIQDEDGNPQQPIRRAVGTTIVAGVDVLLQFLVYEPGTFIDATLPQGEELGFPTVTLLQAAGDPDFEPEPSAITDFCTPLSSINTTLGMGDACQSVVNDDPDDDDKINDGCPALGRPESEAEARDGGDPCDNVIDDDRTDDLEGSTAAGEILGAAEFIINDGCPQAGDTSEADIKHVLFTNPSEPGTYTFTTVGVGQRDADDDGYENTLDVCPFDINEGDPRIGGDGDLDNDGLDAACDPDDNETNSDEDLDGYLNRQDNCPLVPNGQREADIPGVGNQEDNDIDEYNDDSPDGIGDACDPNPDTPDGELIFAETPLEITIGPGSAPAEDETPAAEEDDDGGLGTGVIIVIIIAAVVIIGGGAFYFVRRGSGGGGATA